MQDHLGDPFPCSKEVYDLVTEVITHTQPTTSQNRLLCPWDSRGKDAGVDCHALLHGHFNSQLI